MPKRSKTYRENAGKLDRTKKIPTIQAVEALQSMKKPKFDQTVSLVLRLGIDAKKADQLIRGSVSLPHGLGKSRKVVVFADGDQAKIARDAGAIAVGAEDLVEKVQGGWADFDVAIALPRMMKLVSKLGKVLGPQGKMPSPKSGTVTDEIAVAVKEFMGGRVEYRNDAGGNLHIPVGKLSFPKENLAGNIDAFIEHIRAARPATVKGGFLLGATVSATMTPGVHLAVGAGAP